MKDSEKNRHGGYRIGSGRKSELGKTKSRRIPEDITNDDIKLLAKHKRHNLPLYEMKVEDGVPSILSKDQYKNQKSADNLFINDIEDHFMVKVAGFHLQEAGILENDILLVNQKRNSLQHDNIVIATASTGKAVLKKLIKEGDKIRLTSSNDNCPDIEIDESDESSLDRIWGVVTKVIRDYTSLAA